MPGVQGWSHLKQVLGAVLPFPAFTEFPSREESLATDGGMKQHEPKEGQAVQSNRQPFYRLEKLGKEFWRPHAPHAELAQSTFVSLAAMVNKPN